MRAPLLFAVCLGLWLFSGDLPVVQAEEAPPTAAQVEFFEKSVRPVLAARCFECHGPQKQKAGLRLDSRAALLTGGDSGPAVVPGKPDESRLITAIHYDDSPRMPPKGKLSQDAIAALTTWVKQGAPWPSTETPVRAAAPSSGYQITAKDRAFWSFQPISDPPLPSVSDPSWPKTSIDYFVLAQLDGHGLRPLGRADKRTLIRRATFDLIGLPPTPVEIEAFLKDDQPDAFARVVDRLLASPHYGERWGRYWLDVARYGEDQAHTFQSRKYPYGFRYRDWLVRAFNQDMPYDRFVQEQIAGDLLDGPNRIDRLPALGFFALGPVYYGDPKKLDQLDDRIDTLTRGFLGLTVACARCHDHKFDPIPTRDYYSLAGIFASTDYLETPLVPPEAMAAHRQAQAAVEAQTQRIDKLLEAESARLPQTLLGDSARYLVAVWKLHNRQKSNKSVTVAQVARQERLHNLILDRWVEYLGASRGKQPALAAWYELLKRQDPKVDLSADEAALAEVTRTAQAFQSHLLALWSRKQQAMPQPPLDEAETALVQGLVGARGALIPPKNRLEEVLPAEVKAQLASLRVTLETLKKDKALQYPLVHTLKDGSSPVTMQVHLRGNPETLGEAAPHHFLSILSDEHQVFTQGSGRLELARAIASKDNPLTARVLVNRVWQHHFGKGLVRTPSNFGHLGERPTHPELLDHLASQFVASGWSIKQLHREMMLSATYQLSSQFDAHNEEVDPENRLLWRMNRRRLEVEAWRDAMLAVAQNLDETLGGPSQELTSPSNHRRTFYASVSRHELNGLLRLFDFPDPNITSAERTVTTVPLQQLFVLNSEFMIRNAKALAARLAAEPEPDERGRIRRAYELLYGRPATERELHLGWTFLTAEEPTGDARVGRGENALTRWEQYAQVLLSASEFLFVD